MHLVTQFYCIWKCYPSSEGQNYSSRLRSKYNFARVEKNKNSIESRSLLLQFLGMVFDDFGLDHIDDVLGDICGVVAYALKKAGDQ